MRVDILHNAVAPDAGPDERDVLVQVEAVTAALVAQGHAVRAVPCDLDLAFLRRLLEADRPEVAFNLVESLGGFDRLQFLVPALLDALAIPYTGTGTDALRRSIDKLATKAALQAAGLPVPPCLAVWPPGTAVDPGLRMPADWGGPVIVKPIWDHGSPTLGDDAVLAGTASLETALPRLSAGRPVFAEGFVDGREVNVAVLEGPRGLEALPATEIVFADYPPGKPRIVGFRAKWRPESFEYRHTVRRALGAGDGALAARLADLALRACSALGVRGPARVDFRVDAAGRPYVLELNANPCLSPDAGYAAALAAAGIPWPEAVARMVDAALAGLASVVHAELA